MSEIKTCEQYVLGRLQELEEQNAALQENIRILKEQYEEKEATLSTLSELIHKYSSIRCFESGDNIKHYLSIEDINGYGQHVDDFNFIVKTFDLESETEPSV